MTQRVALFVFLTLGAALLVTGCRGQVSTIEPSPISADVATAQAMRATDTRLTEIAPTRTSPPATTPAPTEIPPTVLPTDTEMPPSATTAPSDTPVVVPTEAELPVDSAATQQAEIAAAVDATLSALPSDTPFPTQTLLPTPNASVTAIAQLTQQAEVAVAVEQTLAAIPTNTSTSTLLPSLMPSITPTATSDRTATFEAQYAQQTAVAAGVQATFAAIPTDLPPVTATSGARATVEAQRTQRAVLDNAVASTLTAFPTATQPPTVAASATWTPSATASSAPSPTITPNVIGTQMAETALAVQLQAPTQTVAAATLIAGYVEGTLTAQPTATQPPTVASSPTLTPSLTMTRTPSPTITPNVIGTQMAETALAVQLQAPTQTAAAATLIAGYVEGTLTAQPTATQPPTLTPSATMTPSATWTPSATASSTPIPTNTPDAIGTQMVETAVAVQLQAPTQTAAASTLIAGYVQGTLTAQPTATQPPTLAPSATATSDSLRETQTGQMVEASATPLPSVTSAPPSGTPSAVPPTQAVTLVPSPVEPTPDFFATGTALIQPSATPDEAELTATALIIEATLSALEDLTATSLAAQNASATQTAVVASMTAIPPTATFAPDFAATATAIVMQATSVAVAPPVFVPEFVLPDGWELVRQRDANTWYLTDGIAQVFVYTGSAAFFETQWGIGQDVADPLEAATILVEKNGGVIEVYDAEQGTLLVLLEERDGQQGAIFLRRVDEQWVLLSASAPADQFDAYRAESFEPIVGDLAFAVPPMLTPSPTWKPSATLSRNQATATALVRDATATRSAQIAPTMSVTPSATWVPSATLTRNQATATTMVRELTQTAMVSITPPAPSTTLSAPQVTATALVRAATATRQAQFSPTPNAFAQTQTQVYREFTQTATIYATPFPTLTMTRTPSPTPTATEDFPATATQTILEATAIADAQASAAVVLEMDVPEGWREQRIDVNTLFLTDQTARVFVYTGNSLFFEDRWSVPRSERRVVAAAAAVSRQVGGVIARFDVQAQQVQISVSGDETRGVIYLRPLGDGDWLLVSASAPTDAFDAYLSDVFEPLVDSLRLPDTGQLLERYEEEALGLAFDGPAGWAGTYLDDVALSEMNAVALLLFANPEDASQPQETPTGPALALIRFAPKSDTPRFETPADVLIEFAVLDREMIQPYEMHYPAVRALTEQTDEMTTLWYALELEDNWLLVLLVAEDVSTLDTTIVRPLLQSLKVTGPITTLDDGMARQYVPTG